VMYTLSATVKTDLKPMPFSPAYGMYAGQIWQRVEAMQDAPMNPRGFSPRVFVLCPMSHIALTLSAEKPTSLHSNTTRRFSIRRRSVGVTLAGYALSSAFWSNSSRKWVFLW